MARSTRGAESGAALGKSVEAYAKAVEKTPDDAGYHHGYALSLAASGRLDEMEPEMEKAATLDPTKAAQYYYTFGGMLLSSGRADAAANAFGKAAKAAPGVPKSIFNMAARWHRRRVSPRRARPPCPPRRSTLSTVTYKPRLMDPSRAS